MTAPAPPGRPAVRPPFRADIQGLRAVAVGMVVVYHIWPHALTGGFVGVDVFFVISGYLITTHLLSRPPRDRAGFASFWARRIRRLLPAALLVLAATAVATRLVAPVTLWADTARQVIASTLYVQNWHLANTSVDYLAQDNAASPLQHYWSLSVEEQFYMVWPLLIAVGAWWSRRSGRPGNGPARWGILAVLGASLAFSVWRTAVDPAVAYFITPTRMWELALGGLVASIPSMAALGAGRRLRSTGAWLGCAAMVATGLTYTVATPFPSYTAVLPVVGAALVIWAGATSRLSPTTIFRWRPIQWIGDVSYSIYLWHWPLIVLLPYVSGGSVGILDQVMIVIATLVLAGLTKIHIEDRFRTARRGASVRRSYQLAVAGMAIVVGLGAAQVAEVSSITRDARQQLATATANPRDCFGAAALAEGPARCPVRQDGELVPAPALAATDESDAYSDHCWSNAPFTDRRTCTYGGGPIRVALVGNSHAGHWLPALQVLAERNGWTITTYLVSRCAATDARQVFDTEQKADNCVAWGAWAKQQTKGKKYDLVITSERQSVGIEGFTRDRSGPAAVAGYERYLRDWATGGTHILVFKDPTFPGRTIPNIPDCLAQHRGDHDVCSAPRDKWIIDDPLVTAVRNVDLPRIEAVSFDDLICDPKRCRGSNGSVVTYFDASHLTATYARSMAPYMAPSIAAVLVH